MEFAKVLANLGEFFEKHHARFGVAGAMALHAYGITRATTDLDLVVERSVQVALLIHLEGLGYERLHVSTGYSNHVHPIASLGRVDFIYVDEPTAAALFSAAKQHELFPGQTVAVFRPEHLAAMKALAMKDNPRRELQDLADVQLLLGVPGVDRELIRQQFERYGMKDKFDELLEKIR